jgi:Secretion system C-terminal sorting domain/Reeler domain
MKRIYVLTLFAFIALVAVADMLDKDGKAARTGSPGEFDCTGCHTSFPVNSGPGGITISSPNLTNWQYVPGQVYQINVTVSQTGVGLFGFGFEALKTSNNQNGGTLSITNSAQTTLKAATISGSSRTNVVHKLNGGLSADTHTFSFNWTAPATNVGNIRFYTAGNAANNNNDSLNDYVYKTSQLVTPFPVGLKTIKSDKNIRIFPNPANEQFTISGLTSNAKGSYQLFDAKGNLVLQDNINTEKAVTSQLVKLPEALMSGVYILKLNSEDLNQTSKLFISK